ncbi:Protein CBG27732 [Caenorhabditis briggsae]|uniref:Protein CBG27732 n=1 Tax=Caenorhabditis briggsae TaxID=6238 RepID=B6IJ30_CAEBR|nr:Protein CBG27732 [Caenorhabditis briggsae]CAS00010.1 Protein CBG27732 [Caenorhabditis briggsae]
MTPRNIAIDLSRIIILYVFIVLIVYGIWMRAMGPVFQVMVKYQPPSGEKRVRPVMEEV